MIVRYLKTCPGCIDEHGEIDSERKNIAFTAARSDSLSTSVFKDYNSSSDYEYPKEDLNKLQLSDQLCHKNHRIPTLLVSLMKGYLEITLIPLPTMDL